MAFRGPDLAAYEDYAEKRIVHLPQWKDLSSIGYLSMLQSHQNFQQNREIWGATKGQHNPSTGNRKTLTQVL